MNYRYRALIIFLITVSTAVYCQDDKTIFKFNGFADSYHALRVKKPNDFMSSRSRLRGELRVTHEKSFLFASLNATHNSILKDQTKFELREAFYQYTTGAWDVKLGRQIITWGVADAMRITDIISPMDYTEFLARDYDDIRIPVNAFKIKYLKTDYNIELIFIPVSEFFIVPTDNTNPWSVIKFSNISIDDTKPEKRIKNSEIGGRFSFYLSGIDFSVSALHTWNKMPVFRSSKIPNNDTIFMHATYKRLNMVGFDLSATLGQFVLRGEAAGYFGEILESKIPGNAPISSDNINVMFGLDWYPGNDLNVSAQLSHKYITDYSNNMKSYRNTSLSTFNITKKLFRNTLSLASFAHIDITNGGLFNRLSADYSLSDQIHLIIGYDHFEGDSGMFGMYKNNSEIWVKGKFSF
ncbi:MAG: hypothetical protein N4A72_12605 [Bacteroidales bacterium]|jgi:hypothetical protein|nr:hypothetical protein [Bacteroidales bacterium]